MLSRQVWHASRESVRSFSVSPVKGAPRVNHYDILGITPKATQTDIKSAYYKLSMKYHPDKSGDEAAAKQFRSITEAYEVLGNIKLKKLYDKGLLGGIGNLGSRPQTPYQEPEPTDPSLKFYKSRSRMHVAPTVDGKTPIYDFDAWSKNHYGTVFNKSREDRETIRRKRERVAAMSQNNNQEMYIYGLLMMFTLFVALAIHGKEEYDIDKTNNKKRLLNKEKTET